jgi:hypothetical protein
VTIPSPTANESWDATFDLTAILKHDRELLAQIHSGNIAFGTLTVSEDRSSNLAASK